MTTIFLPTYYVQRHPRSQLSPVRGFEPCSCAALVRRLNATSAGKVCRGTIRSCREGSFPCASSAVFAFSTIRLS